MPRVRSRFSGKVIYWTLAVVLVLAAGIAWRAMASPPRWNATLFEGPAELCLPGPDAFYSRCVYRHSPPPARKESGQRPEPLTIPGLTPGGRDQMWVEGTPRQASPDRGYDVDAITEATRRERMIWPSSYRDRIVSATLRVIYPAEGAVFPKNLCPPWVAWEDPQNNLWEVTFAAGDHVIRVIVDQRRERFPEGIWEAARKAGDGWVEVRGIRWDEQTREGSGGIQKSPKIEFTVSTDPADNYIVYRLVPPPFHMRKTPSLYLRDIRTLSERKFYKGRDMHCINCHSFSQKNQRMAINIRYVFPDGRRPGALGIYDFAAGKGQKLAFMFPSQGTQYTGWDPTGTRLVIAVNQSFMSAFPIIHETQELEYDQSDLAVWDYGTDAVRRVPGADLEEYVELYPTWGPGGRSLIYARAAGGVSARRLMFDLCYCPYNGGDGGEPQLIPGASENGKSNYFPRCSPDGKWLAFCVADQGSLIESSSDIYMMPADLSRLPHRLESNVDYAADSWHCWSSNSRWLLFSSKRDDGLYTRLYMTHIDEEGHASPPVRLPLEEPRYTCYNVPEFVPFKIRQDEGDLYRHLRFEAPLEQLAEVAVP